uniref:Leucine-rich repeat containing protein n=1 Tax=Rhizophora mucronata TaxID=61149 RepID=A0A2P2IPJ3_RHIMU
MVDILRIPQSTMLAGFFDQFLPNNISTHFLYQIMHLYLVI